MNPLTIADVTLTFGGLNALSNVSMTIEPGPRNTAAEAMSSTPPGVPAG